MMIRKTFLKFQCAVLAFTVIFSMLALCACDQKKDPELTEPSETEIETTQTEATEPEPTETPTPTPSPTPAPMTDAEAEEEALKIAEKYNLSKEELRGKYALFLRYSNVIDCNPEIIEYKQYLYKYFPVIADHLKSENEEQFFGKVSTLKMYNVKTDDFAGGYLGNDIMFNSNIVKDWGEYFKALTVYHELMHFVDGNIDGEVGEVYVMKDGTFAFVPYSEEDDIDKEKVLYHSQLSYFVEGGCEKYKQEYFGTSCEYVYSTGVEFLVGLEYIFGKKIVDDMYFSRDTNARLCEVLRGNGFTNDEIIRLFRTSNTEKTMKDAKKYIDPREVLIRLYEKQIGPDYAKDAKFCRIIACMDKGSINKIPTKYRSFITKVTKEASKETSGMLKKAQKKGGIKGGHFEAKPYPLYIDGELKLVGMITTYKKEKPVYHAVTFDYDFEKKTVKDTKVFNGWILKKTDSQKKLPNEEADALCKELMHDNSYAHNQVVTGSDRVLNSTNIYKRAEELGNKYGIKIWFADLTPSGVLLNDDTAVYDPLLINNALSDIEKVLAMYPEDYFDQLTFEYYSGIAICLYQGWFEEAFPKSAYVNGKNNLMLYMNVDYFDDQKGKVYGYPGAEDVLKQFPKATAGQAQLICDIWNITEKVISYRKAHYEKPVSIDSTWTSSNYKGFKYLKSTDSKKLASYAKKSKMKYFLNKGALANAKNDRILTYEYMMLFAITETKPEGLTPECRAKMDTMFKITRQEFDTSNWGVFTPLERKLIKL